MAKPRTLNPSCFGGGNINFRTYADPIQATTRIVTEDAPMYLDENGAPTFTVTNTPFERHTGMFLDENGNPVANRWPDGVDQTEENARPHEMVQVTGRYEQNNVPLFWDANGNKTIVDTGDPVMSFGTMNATQTVLCKQKDASGNRIAHPGDPENPVGPWSAEHLTMEEIKALHALFTGGTIGGVQFEGFLTRAASEHSLYVSPATAEAAGA